MAYTHEQFLQQVYDLVADEYTVLSQYEETNKKLLMKHNTCGYEYLVSPSKFKQGRRCPSCSGLLKITHEQFLQQVYDLVGDEYTVLSPYKSINEKIQLRHNTCGLEYTVTPSHFKNGNRCPKCSKVSKRKCDTEEFKQKVYNMVGDEYTVLSDYTNNKIHVRIRHNTCGLEYDVRPDVFVNGCRCVRCTCNSGVSKGEKQITDFVCSVYNDTVLENSKSVIPPLELDVYLPNKKLAIEFDGLYWHSEKMGKDADYHLQKTIKCNLQDIQLIHIFEDEWNFKQDIVKAKLKYILGCSKDLPKIRASKCYISELSAADKNQFLNENHIQGEDKASIKLGLWYPISDNEDRLVSVMTFCKPRFNSNYDYELSRFANDIEFQVYGSFDKLFKYFKDNYKWNSIITYADRRWSKGGLYEATGFVLDDISKPSYYYVKQSSIVRENRMNFQKAKLKKRFPDIYDKNLTEFQIMDKANYYRIWDCGNYVYTYTKN